MSEYPNRWYGGSFAKDQREMDAIYKQVVRRFKAEKQVIIQRKTSKNAVGKFKDNYFDFIYIDGDHSKEAVKEDLELYLPKLKNKGILCGDDYYWEPINNFPIRSVVNNFTKKHNLKLKVLGNQYIITR